MFQQRNDFEELGSKVQRAQLLLEKVQGVGVVNGVRVVVDAQNRLISVSVDNEDVILAAYNAAVADKQPKIDDAVAELRADPRFDAISTFADANESRHAATRMQQQRDYEEEDDDYYAERNRRGWLET